MIRLGLNLPFVEDAMDGSTPRWSDILAMGQAAEAIGFDGLWISARGAPSRSRVGSVAARSN